MNIYPFHATDTRRPRSRAAMAATLILAAVSLAACAEPVTRVTQIYDAPGDAEYSGVEYGTVRRIDVVETTEEPTGGGAVIGGLIGGVLGNQVGHGGGRAAATVLGAFGGAVVGNKIEQNQAAANSRRYYRVAVQFNHGVMRDFHYYELNGLHVGARVKLDHGVLSWA
jgi:outer membrane lipoprotein SlyB